MSAESADTRNADGKMTAIPHNAQEHFRTVISLRSIPVWWRTKPSSMRKIYNASRECCLVKRHDHEFWCSPASPLTLIKNSMSRPVPTRWRKIQTYQFSHYDDTENQASTTHSDAGICPCNLKASWKISLLLHNQLWTYEGIDLQLKQKRNIQLTEKEE